MNRITKLTINNDKNTKIINNDNYINNNNNEIIDIEFQFYYYNIN